MPTTTATLTTHQLPILSPTAEHFSSLLELIAQAQRSAVDVEMMLIRNLCGRKRITLKLLDGIQAILDKHGVAVLSGGLKRRQHETVTLLPASAISTSPRSPNEADAHTPSLDLERPELNAAPANTPIVNEPSATRRPWWRRFWQTATIFLFALCLIHSTSAAALPSGGLEANRRSPAAQGRTAFTLRDDKTSAGPARLAILLSNITPPLQPACKGAQLMSLSNSSASEPQAAKTKTSCLFQRERRATASSKSAPTTRLESVKTSATIVPAGLDSSGERADDRGRSRPFKRTARRLAS